MALRSGPLPTRAVSARPRSSQEVRAVSARPGVTRRRADRASGARNHLEQRVPTHASSCGAWRSYATGAMQRSWSTQPLGGPERRKHAATPARAQIRHPAIPLLRASSSTATSQEEVTPFVCVQKSSNKGESQEKSVGPGLKYSPSGVQALRIAHVIPFPPPECVRPPPLASSELALALIAHCKFPLQVSARKH